MRSNSTIRQRSLLSRLVWFVLRRLYKWKGWQLTGSAPDIAKFILLGAPHTSNWDFVFFAGAVRKLGIQPNFVGKNSLFKWPMRDFMLDMGGIPVDRAKRKGGYVNTVIDTIGKVDRIALVVAPEGSRTSDGRWHTGFYHIANGAGIPIVPAWVNHETMQGGVGEPIMPSGDFAADLAKIAAFYRSVLPDFERFAVLAQQADDAARGADATLQ